MSFLTKFDTGKVDCYKHKLLYAANYNKQEYIVVLI